MTSAITSEIALAILKRRKELDDMNRDDTEINQDPEDSDSNWSDEDSD